MEPPPLDKDLFTLKLDNHLIRYSMEPDSLENDNFGELVSTFSELELEYFNVLHDLSLMLDYGIEFKDPRESATLPEETENIEEFEFDMEFIPTKSANSDEVPEIKSAEMMTMTISSGRRQSPSSVVAAAPEDVLRQRKCKIPVESRGEKQELRLSRRSSRLLPKWKETIVRAPSSPVKNEGDTKTNREPEVQDKKPIVFTPVQKKEKEEVAVVSSGERNKVRGRGRGRPGINEKIPLKTDLATVTSPSQLIHQLPSGEHQCIFCRRKFPNLPNFIIHLRIHTGEKPYACNQCNESFKQLCHVQQHSKNVHQCEITKDDVKFTPGRLESLLSKFKRKKGRPAKNAVVTSERIRSSSSTQQTSIPIPKPELPPPPPLSELDLELLEVMDNDENENESEEELIASKELKNYIDDINLQNNFYKPQILRMTQAESNNSVEVDANLLMRFIRPFFNKSGVNCPEDVLQVHSDLRRMLAIPDEEEAQKEIKTDTAIIKSAKVSSTKDRLKPKPRPRLKIKKALKPVKTTSTTGSTVSCKYCKMKFTIPWHLRKHISERHGSLKCGECAMSFHYKAWLLAHMATHASKKNAGESKEFHFCKICKLAFASTKSLRIHTRSHATKSFSTIVSKPKIKAKKNKNSNEVVATKVNIKKRVAKTVGGDHRPAKKRKMITKKGKTPSAKINPKQKWTAAVKKALPHVKMNRMTCSTCHKKFFSRDELEEHMKKLHGDERPRPHVCSECGRGFFNSKNLAQHMQVHLGLQFECKICGVRLARQSTLNIHLRRHAGDFQYECKFCGFKFVERAKYIKHLTLHDGKKVKKCSHCKASFAKPQAYLCHMRDFHPEVCKKPKRKIR